jgi:hypothetical protein
MKRPFGITILAIIFAAVGVSYVVLGLQMTTAVTFGPLPAGQGTWIWGWMFALLGTGSLNYALAITGFPLLLLWYLNRTPVKAAFGLSEA